MLKVRNSSKGQTVFGQVQQGEHEIEYKVTRNNSAWNLYGDICVYIKMTWEELVLLYLVTVINPQVEIDIYSNTFVFALLKIPSRQ